MTAQLAIAAARQAAHDGSALACDVISYEAVSLAGGFLIGSGLYVAAIPARAALATASRLELTNSAASLVSAANIFAGTANTSEVIATIGVLQAERQVLIMELAKLTATTTITIEIVSD
jgi:hypothetical protein